MFRLGGIARRRTVAAIGFLDQFVIAQLFFRGITPVILAHFFMHAFGKGFGQAVGQRRQQDGAVVILGFLESLQVLLLANAGGDDKTANIVVGAFGRDEVRQRQIGAALLARHLLAQGVQSLDREFARLVAENQNVVIDAVGRPEADRGARRQPLFVPDL